MSEIKCALLYCAVLSAGQWQTLTRRKPTGSATTAPLYRLATSSEAMHGGSIWVEPSLGKSSTFQKGAANPR